LIRHRDLNKSKTQAKVINFEEIDPKTGVFAPLRIKKSSLKFQFVTLLLFFDKNKRDTDLSTEGTK
jgi:hypothetical protein